MGEGDIPVVLVPGWVSNVDLYDDPTSIYGAAAEMSRHVRLVVWDKRGTGLSDPVSHVPPIDDLSVGSGLLFEGLGAHRLQGLPEDTEVFRVKAA